MLFLVKLCLYTFIPYWYDKTIHNLGNSGIGGTIHAIAAPLATKIIDVAAYDNVNIREKIYKNLKGDILDLCCGVGYSTKPGSVGIDTSLEMLRFSKFYNPGSDYRFGNAEKYGKDDEFDIVTCMFAFHEIPKKGHIKIIQNAKRIARNKVIIVDISTNYSPSKSMLSGEPYVLDYINSIDETLSDFNKTIVIENHVDMWEYSI